MVKPLQPFTGRMAVGTVRVREIGAWWQVPSWVDDLAAWEAAVREVAALTGDDVDGRGALRESLLMDYRTLVMPNGDLYFMGERVGMEEPAPSPGIALDR